VNLWRYFDLAKFVSLLQTGAIHFPRGDQFEDPFEGSYPLSAVDIFEGDCTGYCTKDWKKFVAVSCWYHSDNESDAMWRLYTTHKQGIAIKTTWTKLNCAVENHAYLTSVKYIDFVKDRANICIPSDVFEYKRKAYIHENEVRAIITKYPRTEIVNGVPLNSRPIKGQEIPEAGISIEVELSNLIDQVVVTPLCTSWFLDVVTGLCNKYGLPAGIVVESELKADPVYAKI
jgi:hypothetical protein